MTRIAFAFLMVILLSQSEVHAQPDPPSKYRILFVFDASGSMYGKWQGKLKIESAKKVLMRLVDSLGQIPRVEMALRVYGHQFPRDCQDSKLEVPFRDRNSVAIKDVLSRINPKGITPIAYSLEQAADDFPNTTNVRNVLILITDGIEECGGDPCAASAKLQANNVVLKPFIIGLGLEAGLGDRLKCAGRYFNAASEKNLNQIMKVVISTVIDNTTLQVKLLDHNKVATETDVNMTFSDAEDGQTYSQMIHTLQSHNEPDIITIDAMPTYNIKVHTLPPIIKKNVRLKPGENNVLDIPAAQGFLKLKMTGNIYYNNLKCIVFKQGSKEIVNVQDINSTVKYLEGVYDIEVLTTPRVELKNVKIVSKATEQFDIPNPGQAVVTFAGSYVGGLYYFDDKNIVKVLDVSTDTRKEILYLQPGRYKYVLRPQNATKTIYTMFKEFEVKSNGVVRLYVN